MKRMLKWPKHFASTVGTAALEVPSMRCRVLDSKLGFLPRVGTKSPDDLCGRVVLSLSDDIDSLCLVRECRELEEEFGTDLTNGIINGNGYDRKEVLHRKDRIRQLERCKKKAPQIAENIGWSKLWDMASDLGWKAVTGLQMLSRAMGHHGQGNHPCHESDDSIMDNESVLDHILKVHWKELHLDSEMDNGMLVQLLSDSKLSKYKNIFKHVS